MFNISTSKSFVDGASLKNVNKPGENLAGKKEMALVREKFMAFFSLIGFPVTSFNCIDKEIIIHLFIFQ